MRSVLLQRLLARFSRLSATVRLMTTLPAHPCIPYGEANFQRIRRHRWLYVDKTRFVRRLEEKRYVFLIRLRRFGKSLWVSQRRSGDQNQMPSSCAILAARARESK